jgi:1-acyl-sn-glycerol-3-phosphate acyltransferase
MSSETEHNDSDQSPEKLLSIIATLAGELHPGRPSYHPASLDSSLDRDYGLDSLSRMELLSRIERNFGITLSEQAFNDAETPRDLLRAIVSADAVRTSVAPEKTIIVETGGSVSIPHQARTLIEVLEWHLAAHPDRPHIHFYSDRDNGAKLSYRQLYDGALAVASGLQREGLQPGSPVAIMLPSSADYFFTFFGILLAGGIPVPIYPPARKALMADHLRRQTAILGNCATTMLVTMPEALTFGRLLKSQLPALRKLVTVTELSSGTAIRGKPTVSAEDTAFLQYTSGSTGNPKGVILSHAKLLTNIRAMGEAVDADETDVMISWLPLYHDMGLIGCWLSSLYYASPLVLLSPLDFLSRPQRWLRAIHRYRGTLSAAPNFAYEICLTKLRDEDLAGLDLSSWRAAFNGAEPVSPNSIERFSRRFSAYGFRPEAMMPVYGMAECTVGLAFPPCGRGPVIDRIRRKEFMKSGRALPATETEQDSLRFVACGMPLAGHEIRVIDASGRELPERREGRVQFRGPSACNGYYRNPEATVKLFDGEWLDTGDLGYIAGGDIYLTGRTKDVVIVAGRNIYPPELEEAVADLPGIRKGNVAVFGSPDPASGTERLVVVAETRETAAAALNRLEQEINQRSISLVGSPPHNLILAPPQTILKTSSGKIRRSATRELYEKGLLGKKQQLWRQYLSLARAALKGQLLRLRQSLVALAFAGYAWSLYALLAAPVWLGALLLPRLAWRWTLMRGAVRFLARATRTPLTVHGLEHLPAGRPCVIVANHSSYLDAYALVAGLPLRFSFVAKSELKSKPTIRWALQRIGTEFVERFDKQKGAADARRLSRRAREEGQSLMFFPEGTFTRIPGLRPFHMGAFIAAAEAGIPVVPVAIRGTRSILRADFWFPRRGTVGIHIGKPLEAAEAAGNNTWERALHLRDSSRRFILSFCGEPDLGRKEP